MSTQKRPSRTLAGGAVVLLSMLAVIAPALGEVLERERVGRAYQRDGDRLLYTEVHRETLRGGEIVEDRVTYLDPSRTKIAWKLVDFRRSAVAPRFRLEDLRTGYVEALELGDGERFVEVRRTRESPLERAPIPGDVDLIADAGFDRFIERHWSTLRQGRTMVRPFLVPSRLEALNFRIRHTGDSDDGIATFELDIDSALLRLVVPSITVRYGMTDRRLISYTGISNIRDEAGNNLDVRVEFSPTRNVGGGSPPSRTRLRTAEKGD